MNIFTVRVGLNQSRAQSLQNFKMKTFTCDAFPKPGTPGSVQRPQVQASDIYGAKAMLESMLGSAYNIRHVHEVRK